jgi:hypothetical protein
LKLTVGLARRPIAAHRAWIDNVEASFGHADGLTAQLTSRRGVGEEERRDRSGLVGQAVGEVAAPLRQRITERCSRRPARRQRFATERV